MLLEIWNAVYFSFILHLEIIFANNSQQIKSSSGRHMCLCPLLSQRLFIRWIELLRKRQSGAFIKRIFAVVLSVLVVTSSENRYNSENLLCIKSLFREVNYNCILFSVVKCFNIVMKVPCHHGILIHLISRIYTVNFMQCLDMKT